MQRTSIEWTHWSVNPFKMRMPDETLINVCLHKSEGCRFCYAEGIVRRWWKKEWDEFPGYTAALLKLGTPVLVEAEMLAVLRLSERIAKGKADPSENRIFWNDMTDEFLEFWPEEFIDKCFAVRALTPNLIHQVLTKRIDRAFDYLSRRDRHNEIELAADRLLPGKGHPSFGGKHMLPALPLPNVHLGTSVEDQKTADERIPLLLETPAAVRWISAEPLLGPVNIARVLVEHKLSQPAPRDWTPQSFTVPASLDWVVVGGESGPKARPMHLDWARLLRDQCTDPHLGPIAFFFKQWGEFLPDQQNPKVNLEGKLPSDYAGAIKVGKKAAGRLLDGREWSEFPKAKEVSQ